MSIAEPNALQQATPDARRLYGLLLEALQPLGPFHEEPKKTSVHLVRKSAFAGVQFRRAALRLTTKAAARIESPRVVKAEQASRNRWHCEVDIPHADAIDAELNAWMRAAYELCA